MAENKKLRGKVALITGGTEGIGLATAKLFVKEGAFVFITGRRQQQLDEAVKVIGSNVSGVQGDVANLADLDRLYKAVGKDERENRYCLRQRRRWRICSLWRRHRRAFRQTIQHQCEGNTVHCAEGLTAHEDGGSIILNGSVASAKGTAAFGVYAASKAAIRSFVRTWTTDLKDRRIRSNVVSPGPINTPLTSRQSADVIARIASTIPMGRMGEPDEVAKAVLFLASDDSSFVTGIELFVDGGRAQI